MFSVCWRKNYLEHQKEGTWKRELLTAGFLKRSKQTHLPFHQQLHLAQECHHYQQDPKLNEKWKSGLSVTSDLS